jgi:outer membrane lipoprotein-sorting protein
MICIRDGVLAILLLVSMVSCIPPSPSHVPAGQPVTDMSPQTILSSFYQRWELATDLRAFARVSATSVQGRHSTRQTFLWRRPALLRLDILSLFGQPSMSLAADAAQVLIYYPAQGTFFQGPPSAATLSRVIGLPLDVDEVAPLLMGYVRPSPAQQVSALYLQTDEAMHLLRFVGPDGQLIQDAWVDPDQLLPRRVLRYTALGTTAVDIAYSDVRHVTEAFPVSHALTIWLPHMETEVRVQFLTVELNPGLSPAVFQLSPPAGVRIHPLP